QRAEAERRAGQTGCSDAAEGVQDQGFRRPPAALQPGADQAVDQPLGRLGRMGECCIHQQPGPGLAVAAVPGKRFYQAATAATSSASMASSMRPSSALTRSL